MPSKRKRSKRSRFLLELRLWRGAGFDVFDEFEEDIEMVVVNVTGLTQAFATQEEPANDLSPAGTYSGYYFWGLDVNFKVDALQLVGEDLTSGDAVAGVTQAFIAQFNSVEVIQATTTLPAPFLNDSIHFKIEVPQKSVFRISDAVVTGSPDSAEALVVIGDLIEALDTCFRNFIQSNLHHILGQTVRSVYGRQHATPNTVHNLAMTFFNADVANLDADADSSGIAYRFRYGGVVMRRVRIDEYDQAYRFEYTILMGMKDEMGTDINPWNALRYFNNKDAGLPFLGGSIPAAVVTDLVGLVSAGTTEVGTAYYVIASFTGNALIDSYNTSNRYAGQVIMDVPDFGTLPGPSS
jgi:hypothetical protein